MTPLATIEYKALEDVIFSLEDRNLIDAEYHMGLGIHCEKKPLYLSLGENKLIEVEIVMNVNSSGEYDGVQGYNFKHQKLEDK